MYDYSQHAGTLRGYVCYVGRLKGSMYLVNARLDLRHAANRMQIEGRAECFLGTCTMGG